MNRYLLRSALAMSVLAGTPALATIPDPWTGPNYEIPGVGRAIQGAGVAFTQFDTDPRPEMILVAYDNPSGQNSFRLKVAWNLNTDGSPSAVDAGYVQVSGVGAWGEDIALAIGDIMGDSRPDFLILAYDAPDGMNTFRYRICQDVDKSRFYNYLDTKCGTGFYGASGEVPGFGYGGDGTGVALVNLDDNPRPELVVMAYDRDYNPNRFKYKIGYNIGLDGHCTAWGNTIEVEGNWDVGNGGGMTFAQLDLDPRPDIVLMSYDDLPGWNMFHYRIGWNMSANGVVETWGSPVEMNGVDNLAEGADLAFYDIDNDGYLDLFLVASSEPANTSAANPFRYRIVSGFGAGPQ